MVFASRNWFAMQGPVAIILISCKVIFIWETGYWTRAIKRFALLDLLKVYIPIPRSCLVQAFLKKWWVESDFKVPNLPLSLRLKVSGCHYNSIYNNTWTKQLFWPLCCLSFLVLRILITPLVSSNSSWTSQVLHVCSCSYIFTYNTAAIDPAVTITVFITILEQNR
jgi:hypothetical protein